jgi:vacuolar protein sorting-associated protein VTA1
LRTCGSSTTETEASPRRSRLRQRPQGNPDLSRSYLHLTVAPASSQTNHDKMAASLPAKLKIKDITPFAVRASQLEKHKPIVSYWCNYYIIDQILSKGLHSADDECMQYTTTLMDKLEQTKTDQAGNDAIVDDIAAKAYIEQFALDTFQRADDAIHDNKASRQTIDTFQAAVTFFDLLSMSIWAPVDPDITAKSKYAKFHAVRIAKAIKAGEDPNDSNPVREEPPADSQDTYHPPTVESAPESQYPSRPASIIQPGPVASPPAQDAVSPVDTATNPRQNSIGGGYFPSTPTFVSDPAAAPSAPPANPATPFLPSAPPPAIDAPVSPSQYYTQPTQPPTSIPMHTPAVIPPPVPAPVPLPPVQAVAPGTYRTDDDSIMLAQKHAKWAMSALNFEDVDTAVKELRLALQTLGAT